MSVWRIFGSRRQLARLPSGAACLPGALLGWTARWRRRKGCYDRCTLALYRLAWRRSRSASALLDYLLFRRDLGYALSERWRAPLGAACGALRGGRRLLALALLDEAAQAGSGLPASGGEMWSDGVLATLRVCQSAWQEAFRQLLLAQQAGGICVVGNGGRLRGAALGEMIDRQGLVLRFNRFQGGASGAADLGRRLDVWVTAPGFDGPVPAVGWIVVSGPDMRFRRQNWDRLAPAIERGTPVLSVPLEPWRALVAQLQAPPSAGILMLAWLKSLLGSWAGIVAVGFGRAASAATAYHQADPAHRPAGRHDWIAEHALLARWQGEGLNVELAWR